MDKINSRHLIFIFMALPVVSIKTYPTIYTINSRENSWISIIIASLIIITLYLFILKVFINENHFNIYEIYTKALGNIIGKIFLLLYIFSMFLTLIECCSVESNSMNNNLLFNTPSWMFILALVIPAFYILRKNYSSLITVTVISLSAVAISGMNLAILTERYKDYSYLIPVSKILNIDFIKSIIKLLGLYGSTLIALPFFCDIVDKNKIKKFTLISLLIVIQISVVGVIGVISTYGERINYLVYPKLTQTQLINYFDFIQFGELYVLLQMVIGWTIKFTIVLCSIKKLLFMLNFNSTILSYLLGTIAAFFSIFLSSNYFNLFIFLNYYSYISFINFILIPALVFFLYYFKKKKNKAVQL